MTQHRMKGGGVWEGGRVSLSCRKGAAVVCSQNTHELLKLQLRVCVCARARAGVYERLVEGCAHRCRLKLFFLSGAVQLSGSSFASQRPRMFAQVDVSALRPLPGWHVLCDSRPGCVRNVPLALRQHAQSVFVTGTAALKFVRV